MPVPFSFRRLFEGIHDNVQGTPTQTVRAKSRDAEHSWNRGETWETPNLYNPKMIRLTTRWTIFTRGWYFVRTIQTRTNRACSRQLGTVVGLRPDQGRERGREKGENGRCLYADLALRESDSSVVARGSEDGRCALFYNVCGIMPPAVVTNRRAAQKQFRLPLNGWT